MPPSATCFASKEQRIWLVASIALRRWREYHDEAEDNFGEALERTEDAGAKDPDAHDSAATCFCESSVAWASDVKRSMRPT